MSAAQLDLRGLAAIIVSVSAVMAPHTLHVPTWTIAFCALALVLRLYIGWQRKPLPSSWLLIALTLVAFAGILVSYRTLFGRDSGVALLLAMAALKLLEMSRTRDVNIVMVLCYFLALTNFFYTQTIATALYSTAAIWVITATMVGLQHLAVRGRMAVIFRTSGILLAQAVPVMLVLFVLFPRIQGPLWGLPQIQHSSRSGLSDSMSPGMLSELSLSDEIAFRAQFEALPQNPQQLYWRGPVMWDFDGRTWRSGQPTSTASMRYAPLAPPLRYSVTLEPHHERWLFLIDLPVRLPPSSILTRDYQVLSYRPVRERLRYEAESVAVFRTTEPAFSNELRRALQLPPDAAPQTRLLVQNWRSEAVNDRLMIERALQMFREQPFIYTLAPPPLGREPVDEFLFDTRSGFCEHYASSFAVMMRAAGIPARIVTGYLGGEVNSVDGYLVVRQSEAHAWNEVWLPDEGWVRVDPTAAVSPLRIQQGLATAAPATDPQPLFRRARIEWLRQARDTWDAVTNSWNQWVLGYSPERQSRFLNSFGLSNVSWQDMVIALMLATGVLILAFATTMFLRLRARSSDEVQRAWLGFCEAMAKRGAARGKSEGPRDFTSRLVARFPDLRERVETIGALYVRMRYGGLTDPQSLKRFRREIAATLG